MFQSSPLCLLRRRRARLSRRRARPLRGRLALRAGLLPHRVGRLLREVVELDESARRGVVESAEVRVERGHGRIEEAVRGLSGTDPDLPLVERDLRRAGYTFIRALQIRANVVHRRLEVLGPVAEIRPLLINASLELVLLASRDEILELLVRRDKHRRRRVLVDTPDFQADDSVLHDLVEAAASLSGALVELHDQVPELELLPVHRDGYAFLEVELQGVDLVGGLLGRLAPAEDPLERRCELWVLDLAALGRVRPHVLVIRVRRLARPTLS